MVTHRPRSGSHPSLLERCDNVPQKVVELHISTIRAIIKKCQVTGDVNNGPGRGHVSILTTRTVRRMVPVAKTSPRITAGELQTLVGSWGQKVSKTTIRRHLHNHKLFRRVAIKSLCCHQTTNSSTYSLPNVTGSFNGTRFYGQMGPK
jgi:hypothetical protein